MDLPKTFYDSFETAIKQCVPIDLNDLDSVQRNKGIIYNDIFAFSYRK